MTRSISILTTVALALLAPGGICRANDPPPAVYTNDDLPPVPYHWQIERPPVVPAAVPTSTGRIASRRSEARPESRRRPSPPAARPSSSSRRSRAERLHRAHELWQDPEQGRVNRINRINRLWPDRDADWTERRLRESYRREVQRLRER